MESTQPATIRRNTQAELEKAMSNPKFTLFSRKVKSKNEKDS